MKAYICQICNHLLFNEFTDKCPKCGADKKEIKRIDNYLNISHEKIREENLKKRLLKLKLNSHMGRK